MKLLNKEDFLKESDRRKSKYFKTVSPGIMLLLIPVILLAAGFTVWLFSGSYNLTLNGYAYVMKDSCAYCYVEAGDINKVSEGMRVMIGNSKGKVTEIDPVSYGYEDYYAIYGVNAKQKLHMKENAEYYVITADIKMTSTGFREYTMITSTAVPYEYLAGGVSK